MSTRYRFGWIPDHGDPRDRSYAFWSALRAEELPQAVDWAKVIQKYPSCYDQGQTGSCVGQSLARMFHLRELLQGFPLTPALSPSEGARVIKPSPMFIYYNARLMEGATDADNGCQIRDGLKTLLVDGCCDDSAWPLNVKFVTTKPFDSCYDEARAHTGLVYRRVDSTNLQDLLSALALGPVVGGVSVFTSFMDAKNGEVQLPGDADSFEGGHALCWTGYDQGAKRFTFDNSWGASWGNHGRGSVPFDYLTDADLADDFWLLQKTT